MEKFLVIEPFVHKEEHSIVDRAFLEYFSIFKSTVLVNETLRNNCSDLDLTFLPSFKDTNSNKSLFRWVYREIYKVLYTSFVLLVNLFTRKRVVFLAMSQFQFFVFGLLCLLCRFKVSVVMHHYAESLIKPIAEITLADKLFLAGYRFFNRLSGTHFLFLSKHIKHAIPVSEKNYFINHPISKNMIDSVDVTNRQGTDNSAISMATIGLLSPSRKNSHLINELARGSDYDLWVIGRFARNEEFKIASDIKSKLWSGIYSTTEFQNAISDIDCFVYFFDKDQYRCTASGTLIDAILYGKYVISLRNAAAESLLCNYDKKIFFDSINEMNEFLQNDFVNTYRNSKFNVCDSRYSYCLVSTDFTDMEIINKCFS